MKSAKSGLFCVKRVVVGIEVVKGGAYIVVGVGGWKGGSYGVRGRA